VNEDQRRFRDFVAARTPTLMRIAYLLAGNQHDAEDLLQTALTRTAARLFWIRHTDPEAYVRKVLYRESISSWRRIKRREVLTWSPPDGVTTDPGHAADLRLTVRQALLRLTRRQRAVLVLRYFEDLPEAEVAEILGCSVGTVRSQSDRAKARLRRIAPELADADRTTEVRR
jgi:RNA polymerase sigma-70 factor (sigma-E family)